MPVCTYSLFSMWLKHMIALAWRPLTPSCLNLPDRSAERIKAQRKARGEPEFTFTPAQQLCCCRRLHNPLHYTTQRFCGCVIGRSKLAYAQRNIHTTACVGCLVWYHVPVPVSPHYLCSYWPHNYQDFNDVKNVGSGFLKHTRWFVQRDQVPAFVETNSQRRFQTRDFIDTWTMKCNFSAKRNE